MNSNYPPSGRKAGPFDGRKLRRFKRFITLTLHVDTSDLLEVYMTYWNDCRKTKGLVWTCKHAKSIYDSALRLAAGVDIKPIPFLKSDKKGFPKAFNGFKKFLLSNNKNEVRAALAILNLWRNVKVPGNWTTDSISRPGIMPVMTSRDSISPGGFFRRLGRDDLAEVWTKVLEREFPTEEYQLRVKKIQAKKNIGLHISSKNGPNGPAVYTALVDLSTLTMEIRSSMIWFATFTGNKDLLKLVKDVSVESPKMEGATHSKIALKVEAGGKVRPFAICDWFSQSSLLPLHRYLFNWLESQAEDGTFSHVLASNEVKEWTKEDRTPSKVCYSSDLTAATDRLPRELQAEILCQMFGQDLSKHWLRIVGEREFRLPTTSIGKTGDDLKVQTIKYAVGQPMGILSSWAMLAVFHHCFTRMVYNLSKVDYRSNYKIIGDDIITRGTVPSKLYQSLMDVIGAEISVAKSFLIPNTDEAPVTNRSRPKHAAEFAKRVFVDGNEITPITCEEFENGMDPGGFTPFLRILKARDWSTGLWEDVPPALAKLSDKPNYCLLSATNPSDCAPHYLGVTTIYHGLSPLGEERTLGVYFRPDWWFYTPEEIFLCFSKELRKKAADTLKESRKEINKYTSLKPTTSVRVSRWMVDGNAQCILLKAVAKQARETIDETMGSLLMASKTYKDLRKEIAKVSTIIELDLIIAGKTNFNESKHKNDRLYSSLQRKVMKRLSAL